MDCAFYSLVNINSIWMKSVDITLAIV